MSREKLLTKIDHLDSHKFNYHFLESSVWAQLTCFMSRTTWLTQISHLHSLRSESVILPEASTSSFTNSPIKTRTVKRVENSLPKSTRRENKVIKNLASKFNMKIKLGRQARRKKKWPNWRGRQVGDQVFESRWYNLYYSWKKGLCLLRIIQSSEKMCAEKIFVVDDKRCFKNFKCIEGIIIQYYW